LTRVFVATTNPGKLRELDAILSQYGWKAVPFADYREPVEGDTSYAENAALKARALFAQLQEAGIDAPALGDDSGLEVRALDGRPGVLSARFGGPDSSWTARRAALLQAAVESGNDDRGAQFVCALHMVDVDGRETAVEARLAGRLASSERGAGGFSYDAIFELSDGRTFAELTEDEKNAISHRALAVRALIERNRRDAPGSSRASGM
jgi:XTP/dITP diphosphohydrolase